MNMNTIPCKPAVVKPGAQQQMQLYNTTLGKSLQDKTMLGFRLSRGMTFSLLFNNNYINYSK